MKLIPVLTLASCGLFALPAHALMPTFNLVIDVTNPSAVTFTATVENGYGNGSALVNFSGGITIENFFSTDQDATDGLAISGDWTARGTTTAYDQLVTFHYGSPDVVLGDDLSIYVNNLQNTQLQSFITGASLFTGTSTVDFTDYALPEAGSWGAIYIGYQPDQGGLIGYWTVVTSQIPEPSTGAALAGVGALVCVGACRRRRIWN